MPLTDTENCLGSLFRVRTESGILLQNLGGNKVGSLFFNKLKAIQSELWKVQECYGAYPVGFKSQVDGILEIVSKYVTEKGEPRTTPSFEAARGTAQVIWDNANELIRMVGQQAA